MTWLNLVVEFPLTNPVLIFSVILFIILFAPIILNRFKIPHLIGLIIAGAIIGPNGLGLLLRDSSVVLFGTVGLLYIMFLAGLEIDLAEFKKNSWRSLIFGMYTFLIPMALGTTAGYYILGFSIESSVLLASMFASHTLITYPMVSKLGVSKNRAVNITVGGTMITDTLALLVLAVIVGMTTGEVNQEFWVKLSLSIVIFALVVVIGFPALARWFFKRYDDSISQYIFVLALVFLGAFLAEAAGIEAIIGAFLAGLSLNRLIPRTSPLMNRVEFVGNALFIPFFLIGVGMLIDFKVFFTSLETIFVAFIMTVIATGAKFSAAWMTQKTFRLSIDERRLVFGLSNAQAAATLAAVLVGYNIILNQGEIDAAALEGVVIEPIRLLSESVLNGTILMILVTCTIASIVTQRGAHNLAKLEMSGDATDDKNNEPQEKILVPVNNIETVEELINFSLAVKSKANKTGLYALNVVDNSMSGSVADKQARKILDIAVHTASAADVQLHELLRYDVNAVNGIAGIVREHRITDTVLGLHQKKGFSDNFLGNLTEGILAKCNTTTFVYKPSQPLATIKRFMVVVPENAEMEEGFMLWLTRMRNIAKNTSSKLVFYGAEQTLCYIRDIKHKDPVECEFMIFDEWSDFLILSRDLKHDDTLVLILSRRNHPSYNANMSKIPYYLNKYFQSNSFILIYPVQAGEGEEETITDFTNPSAIEPYEKLDDLGRSIANIFRKDKV